MIRLFLADDHTLVREGLKQLFADSPDIEVVGEAADANQVLEQLRYKSCDLLLLDVTMPGMSAEDLLERLQRQQPTLPVLMLSMHNEPQIARRQLKAGASGYLTKDCEPERLLEAISRVAAGGRYLSPEMAERIAFELDSAAEDLPTNITRRELQILRLLVQGANQNDIASRLAISNKTVSTHKTRLMRKLGITSNAELIRFAVANGLGE
ncbi:response regulator transcription factor [Marinobacterium sp. D7]|uniref:response regulator n=1 Tax=Marinobacterium ramblicola TaxID=2849041 RepID=UPI001C2CCC32|nr:response regulator transcription factor [Marinobacterium ramblicola]MBV1787365.1 response regulator transcription factor [Marinobacterium ramblicola]